MSRSSGTDDPLGLEQPTFRNAPGLFDWQLDETDHRRLHERDRDEPCDDIGVRDWSGDVYVIAR